MVDIEQRRAILRRRMAFVSSTLAVLTGCDKGVVPQPPEVTVDPDGSSGLPVEASSPTPKPDAPKLVAHPPTTIPETCEAEANELRRLQTVYDELYAETEAIYAAVPSACAVTDDACKPKYQPLAKRVYEAEERGRSVLGMCSCPAPLVREYAITHSTAVRERIALIRQRIIDTSGDRGPAETQWDELVRNEATPRPCLSCVRCEPKSACD